MFTGPRGDNKPMDESFREVFGFLCRWCLLGAVSATVVAMSWASLHATAAAKDDLGARMSLPDAIWQLRESGKAVITGYLSHRATDKSSLLICSQPGGRQSFATTYKGQFRLRVSRPRPGRIKVLVKGVPYGPLAFRQTGASVTVVQPGMEVFLLDVRLILNVPSGQGDDFRRCMGLMQRRGEAAAFHSGSLEQFDGFRDKLRRLRPDMPLLCSVKDAPDNIYVLRQAARALKRWPGRRRLVVVTGDAELAVEAARQGFTVHLVAPRAEEAPAHPRLMRFRRFGQLKDYLAAEPISN